MSIATCTRCFDQIDTDKREMYEVDDDYVCDKCFLTFPHKVAELDYEHGGGFDDNPYEKDDFNFLWYEMRMNELFTEEGKKRMEETAEAINKIKFNESFRRIIG